MRRILIPEDVFLDAEAFGGGLIYPRAVEVDDVGRPTRFLLEFADGLASDPGEQRACG